MTERQQLTQEITNLTASLTSTSSRIGDWAVTKCLEYEKMGKEAPYDLDDLMAQRQKVRDRINELQAQLAALPEDEQ
jgi:uncharacterized protein involved in exopolysaccharide biosynthesis